MTQLSALAGFSISSTAKPSDGVLFGEALAAEDAVPHMEPNGIIYRPRSQHVMAMNFACLLLGLGDASSTVLEQVALISTGS
jgi:hypothetical protein